jgi:subtilisin family serine protease
VTQLHFAPELDPRLRRMLHAAGAPGAPPDADGVTAAGPPLRGHTKVLVELSGDEPPRTSDQRWARVADGFWSVELATDAVATLADSPAVRFVEGPRPFAPTLVGSVPATRADAVHAMAPAGRTGAGVVVGIIDFGLDVTLDDFRRPDGSTRVAYLWDQGLEPSPGERSPTAFGYGTEYDAAAIDAALATDDPFAVVRHAPEPASHGTHVCGIAAGNGRTPDATRTGRHVGTAPEATIVFVQPAAEVATTFTDSAHVADAVAYVFARADELGMPCVVNMSLGQNGGSHDGESIVERAIDRLLEQPGRAMTVAAGNEHVWRGHAAGTLAPGGSCALRWAVGGGLPLPGGGRAGRGAGDVTPNEVEVWYSPLDALAVVVRDPAGEATPELLPGATEVHTFADGTQAFVDSERFSRLNGESRIYVEVAPAPGRALLSGEWRIELRALEVRDGRFDAWIERDVRRPDNAFADQSFFAGSDFDPVRTLGTPATARRAVAVANYDHRTTTPHESSSRGPTRDGRAKPEVAAPGTDVVSSSAFGGRRMPDGTLVPARVAMTGTSMAAPHVAGVVALLLQEVPTLEATQVARLLQAAADPPPGATLPFDPAWGSGRVDARRAVELLRPGTAYPAPATPQTE